MDENNINIQKYLIWFDEVEKISLFGDDEDWVLSDSDTEIIMDQNEVISTQPNTSGGYVYTPETTSYSPSTANYQYANDVITTYTNSETVVDPSVTTDCNGIPNNYGYTSQYLAPSSFYGNSAYVSAQYEKVENDGVTYNQGEQNTPTESNVYSSNVNNVPGYVEQTQETVIEAKTDVVNEVYVEDAKVEVKIEEVQPIEEPQTVTQREEVIEHTTVTVKPEVPQHGVTEFVQPNQESQDTCEAKAEVKVEDEATRTIDQSVSNGNKPAPPEVQNVQMCIRSGCANQAVNNPEWEQEFCSNECVILHCKMASARLIENWLCDLPTKPFIMVSDMRNEAAIFIAPIHWADFMKKRIRCPNKQIINKLAKENIPVKMTWPAYHIYEVYGEGDNYEMTEELLAHILSQPRINLEIPLISPTVTCSVRVRSKNLDHSSSCMMQSTPPKSPSASYEIEKCQRGIKQMMQCVDLAPNSPNASQELRETMLLPPNNFSFYNESIIPPSKTVSARFTSSTNVSKSASQYEPSHSSTLKSQSPKMFISSNVSASSSHSPNTDSAFGNSTSSTSMPSTLQHHPPASSLPFNSLNLATFASKLDVLLVKMTRMDEKVDKLQKSVDLLPNNIALDSLIKANNKRVEVKVDCLRSQLRKLKENTATRSIASLTYSQPGINEDVVKKGPSVSHEVYELVSNKFKMKTKQDVEDFNAFLSSSSEYVLALKKFFENCGEGLHAKYRFKCILTCMFERDIQKHYTWHGFSGSSKSKGALKQTLPVQYLIDFVRHLPNANKLNDKEFEIENTKWGMTWVNTSRDIIERRVRTEDDHPGEPHPKRSRTVEKMPKKSFDGTFATHTTL